MDTISGTIYALYAFDVAEEIHLGDLMRSLGPAATLATVYDKAPGARVHYVQPPVMVDGSAFGCADVDGFRVRLKFYDYGVISIALVRAIHDDWPGVVTLGHTLVENEAQAQQAEDICRQVVAKARPVMTHVRTSFLTEDYLVLAVTATDPPVDAETLLAKHGTDIAQLVRGERQLLSPQERDETLRYRLSYLSSDLVIPTWNAVFIYDAESAIPATLEVVEFANSQLLEFRYHDERLEVALDRIYAELQHPRALDRVIGRRNLRATRDLHSLFIDVNELTDHLENALKLVGEVYAARLFTLVASRLGLDHWKRNVQDKLNTLNDIYRFAVEQTRVSQGNILELVIVLILIFELGLTLKGLIG